MFDWQTTPNKRMRLSRAIAKDPCPTCFGRGEVVFDQDAIADIMRRNGIEVNRVVGEAFVVCPQCNGDRVE